MSNFAQISILSMKKIVLTIMASLMCTGVFAQEWIFGILGGGNIASIAGEGYVDIGTGETLSGSNNRPLGGGFVGALIQCDFDNWGLRSEVYYSQQGSKINISETYPELGRIDFTTSRRSNNINVPVLAYIKLLDDRLSIMAGPTLGFCLSGTDYLGNINRPGLVPEKIKWAKSGYNVLDIAATIGAEFMFIDSVGILLRFSHGFRDVFTSDGIEPAYGKNNVIQIGVEYKFGR